ncbi:hypothetical protein LEMLEM_LOCUS765, partial [Lemmus lemmus]
PSPADPQRAPRWVSGRCPRRFSPVPWSSVPGRGGWPELRPPLTLALQFLTRARGCRGHWALRSERVVSGEPEVHLSRLKADASSQAWPRQRLRVTAPYPVASRSSSHSPTCSSSLSLMQPTTVWQPFFTSAPQFWKPWPPSQCVMVSSTRSTMKTSRQWCLPTWSLCST